MTTFALALVLSAAFVHATWNLLAKRVAGSAAFIWLFGLVSICLYAPLAVAIIVFQQPYLGPEHLLFIVGSGVLHIGYYLALQRGYRVGDLSLVYPLARGTGPMLATAAAIAFFGERPTTLALGGAILIGISVFTLASGSRRQPGSDTRAAVVFGILTGAMIASYTLWDKHAVSVLLVPPLLMDWGTSVTRVAVLTPVAVRRWGEVCNHWKLHRREVLGIALLNPLSYILVLTAMVFTPVSYVAPAREVSILIGTVMGARLLAEGDSSRRLLAAAGMVMGVVALAVG
jgi:drug/metabolite transporter (DMT)-like permease